MRLISITTVQRSCNESTWRSRVRTLKDYISFLEVLLCHLEMAISDTIKYTLLGISVGLFLLGLGLLCWQTFIYCNRKNTNTRRARVNSLLLYPNEWPIMAEMYSNVSNTKVVEVSTEVHRLSRCLPPSSDSSQTEGEVEEQVDTIKVHGSLHFSVHYDPLQSRLVVTVLQVEGLEGHSQTCSLQLYVKLRLMWEGSQLVEAEDYWDEQVDGMAPALWAVLQEWRTGIVKGSCNPLFGDQFSCFLQQDNDVLHHTNLRMEVWDYDNFSRNTILGEVRVPLRQLSLQPLPGPLELHELLQIPHKDLVGEVLLSLKFLPTSQRLEVGLLKVRTVFAETDSDAALYAKISIQCNQCRLRYQKTTVVSRCLVTIFNEVFMFTMPEFPLELCKITVCVYETHTSRTPNKQLMGQLTVMKERSSEDKHWNLMMRSVRQPVAKWHGLMI